MSKKRKFNVSSAEVSRRNKELLQTLVFRNEDLDDEEPELHPTEEEDGPEEDLETKPVYDEGEFYELKWTAQGKRALELIREKRRILMGNDKKLYEENHETPPKYQYYDPSKVDGMLGEVINKVQSGKYGKAMDVRSRGLLNELIASFLGMDQKLPNAARVNATVRNLIKVCKSFYEYDERQFLDDETYDQVVARWRSLGFEEPTGYVPNKSRKTAINHPRLHNNMDKAYRIYMNDPVPIGVKESDSVENWLIRNFRDLGISSETVIKLEVSPKIDGVSGSGNITAKGIFEDPQTRGDDTDALDIRGMDGLELVEPKLVTHPFGIQFEIFVTEPDRLGASAYLEKDPPYVSCRHAASGVVNQLCTGDDNNLLQFCSLYPIEADGLDELTYEERMRYLANFAIVPKDMIPRKIIKGNMKRILQELKELFRKWEDDRENHSFTYDGMVLTLVDDDYQKVLGRQGRTNLYQIALKFNPASAIGKVAGIHLDFGKKGYRTLQVDLEHAIFLDGVRYDHVPVLSANLFMDHHLRIGDEVRVNRVGDVIPSISVEKTNYGKLIQLPTNCPDCGHILKLRNSKLYCGNPQCVSNLAGRIEFFLKALDIDRYGENFARMVVELFDTRILDDFGHTVKYGKGICVRGLRDLFDLTPEAFEAKGITTKDAKLFLTRLEEAVAKAPDYEVLGAMGIPDLGRARAYDILKAFGSLEAFISAFNKSEMEGRLRSAVGDGIGVKIHEALNISDGWEDLQEDVIGVFKHVKNFTDFNAHRTKVGHTGLKKFPPDVQEILERRGFMVVDGKNFDILIAADLNSTSGKMQMAQKRKLPVMTLDGFRERYGN